MVGPMEDGESIPRAPGDQPRRQAVDLTLEWPADGAELTRGAAGRLPHRGGEAASRTPRKDALGVADHRDRPDGNPRAVEDRRGDAGFTQDRLVPLDWNRMDTDVLELHAQRSRRRGPFRQPLQRR